MHKQSKLCRILPHHTLMVPNFMPDILPWTAAESRGTVSRNPLYLAPVLYLYRRNLKKKFLTPSPTCLLMSSRLSCVHGLSLLALTLSASNWHLFVNNQHKCHLASQQPLVDIALKRNFKSYNALHRLNSCRQTIMTNVSPVQ